MLSDKAIKEYKEIYKKKFGKDISDAEAREQGERLLGFYKILFKQAETDLRRKKRMEKEKVKGFFLEATDGVYTCGICHDNRPGNEIWWTPKGLSCADCQRNVEKKVIPPLTWDSDHKIWFDGGNLQYDYGLHSATIRKLERQGVLKGKDLVNKEGYKYFTVFLVKENQDFLKKYPKKPKLKIKYE